MVVKMLWFEVALLPRGLGRSESTMNLSLNERLYEPICQQAEAGVDILILYEFEPNFRLSIEEQLKKRRNFWNRTAKTKFKTSQNRSEKKRF